MHILRGSRRGAWLTSQPASLPPSQVAGYLCNPCYAAGDEWGLGKLIISKVVTFFSFAATKDYFGGIVR